MGRIKVAVTGAAGQIGSVLVRRMLELPHIDPIAICRNSISAGIIHFSSPQCNIRIGSITDIDSAKQLLGDAEVIINCALAMISANPKESRLQNEAMTDCFFSMEKMERLIHLSSLSVYGGWIDGTKSEFEKPRPDSDYGRAKLRTEKHIKKRALSRNVKYYILRLGNVYGAKMDRSRQLIELAQTPYFRLPFNGELPSNSIHVEKLAAVIIALISNQMKSGIYNVAEKQKTWRQVFDWHTQSLKMPPVSGMPRAYSLQLKNSFRKISIIRDIIGWLSSLPILSLVKYPAIFDGLYYLLNYLPLSLRWHLATKYKRLEAGRQISEISKKNNRIVSPVYFSNAMPGNYLILPLEAGVHYPVSEKLSYSLVRWNERYSKPKWLPNSFNAN